ncbi:hypothetical protein ASZ90_008167 [hydrocarbon metagenome]|uniref:Glycosyltransferase RgtA/B/C/D-like domain-containing protein n=1 Tax=hydrocarbon metagenome TaxID=938273 RepID=A0A0W8FMB2_9ZZZZ
MKNSQKKMKSILDHGQKEFFIPDKFKPTHSHSVFFIIIVLALLIIADYWPVQNYEFLNYDDPLYVTSNYQIQSGITFKSIAGTFTNISTSNWHPLTMISHMLDWTLFGNNVGGHHWTNVIIHIFNTILLFLLFNILTGALWQSALVAALFAIHPLNVESVAWIAERKNVLSTFFLISTILFYIRYVKSPGYKKYLPVLICFALGLMSKPMLVTLPLVLLLLDYWPLNRMQVTWQTGNNIQGYTPILTKKRNISFLIVEKVPLFILSFISIFITIYAARHYQTIAGFESFPVSRRIYNMIFSYSWYVKKFFYPTDLAAFYPHAVTTLQFLAALLFLIIITFFVYKHFRKHPYLLVGWLWYLGTLVPVIGIVQVGYQTMADRYAYVPLIGIFIMAAWGLPQLLLKIKNGKIIAAFIAAIFIVIITMATYLQVHVWKNNYSLLGHALSAYPENYSALQFRMERKNPDK